MGVHDPRGSGIGTPTVQRTIRIGTVFVNSPSGTTGDQVPASGGSSALPPAAIGYLCPRGDGMPAAT